MPHSLNGKIDYDGLRNFFNTQENDRDNQRFAGQKSFFSNGFVVFSVAAHGRERGRIVYFLEQLGFRLDDA